jgi:hypothetical protein
VNEIHLEYIKHVDFAHVSEKKEDKKNELACLPGSHFLE